MRAWSVYRNKPNGHATGAELWALAQRVREGVHARFGVMLEPEPCVIGAVA